MWHRLGLPAGTLIGVWKFPFLLTSTAVTLSGAETVQERPLLSRKRKARLSDCGVVHEVCIDHRGQLPGFSQMTVDISWFRLTPQRPSGCQLSPWHTIRHLQSVWHYFVGRHCQPTLLVAKWRPIIVGRLWRIVCCGPLTRRDTTHRVTTLLHWIPSNTQTVKCSANSFITKYSQHIITYNLMAYWLPSFNVCCLEVTSRSSIQKSFTEFSSLCFELHMAYNNMTSQQLLWLCF